METQKYKKTGGMGLHGGDYQIKLLSLFLLEAFKKKEHFRLSTENKDAGKFDDVVLQTDHTTIFLQAKHKEDPKDKKSFITYEDIVNPKKDEFYLYKYLKCVPDIQKKFNNITALILCTNTTFTKDKKDEIKKYILLEEMKEDHIFYFSDRKFYYTFKHKYKEIMPTDKSPEITVDVFELFLEKMQLISIDDSNIDRRIESLIKEIDIFDAVKDTRQAVLVLKEYIKNWVEDKNGTYIIPQHLGVFRSQHFLNELKQLDVEFNATQQETTLSKYTCFKIENVDNAKIHLFKFYTQFQKEKMLIVDYNETLSRKEEIVSAFVINEFVYLLIPLFENDYQHLKTVIKDIALKTFDREYKKIIFIVENVAMSQEISKDLNHTVDVHRDVIKFETFSESYQNELCSRVIRFQGKDVQLKDIVPVFVLNSILEETILLKLIYKKQIVINERYRESTINFYVSRSLYSTSSMPNSTEENSRNGNLSKGQSSTLHTMMTENETYNKTGGMDLHGGDYQIKLLSLFLLEAFKKNEEFRLSTEIDDGGKFNNIVLQTYNTTIFLQAKHKEDPKDKKSFITYEDIVNPKKDEFYLFKYLKYFLDIQKRFDNITALILCTNTTFTKDKKDEINTYICTEEMEEDHIFYFSDNKFYYTFNDNYKEIMPTDINPEITEDAFELFLEKMQLISIDHSNIDRRIESLIKEIDIFDAARDTRQAVLVLKEYIKNRVEDKNGTYIIPQHLGVFRSQHFLNELKQLDVEFKVAQPEIANLSKYTCFTIENRDRVKFHLVKIYKQLETEKILIVDCNDTISRQEEIISAFVMDEFVYLLIPLFESDYCHLKTAINDIAVKTFERKYKKIIFIVEKADVSEELSRDLNHLVDARKAVIRFEEFSESYQNELCSRVIRFQGKDVQLKDVVPISILNTILEESVLESLMYKKQIIISERHQESPIYFYVSRSVNRPSSLLSSKEETSSDGNLLATGMEEIFSEEDFCNIICNDNNIKTILLTSGPGMGKTSILSNLQNVLNSKFNFWITKINLLSFTEIFQNHLTRTPAELLTSLVFDPNSTSVDFEKRLFNLPSNVILMLDAVDEIQPVYSDLISKLIQYCEGLDNIRSVIITSRPHAISSIIEAITNAAVFSLRPLSREFIVQYLCQYWTNNLTLSENDLPNFKMFVEKSIEKLDSTIIENLLSVPLYTRMIAEIFQGDYQTYLASNKFEPEFINQLNIADLYAMFIEKKRKTFYEQFKADNYEL